MTVLHHRENAPAATGVRGFNPKRKLSASTKRDTSGFNLIGHLSFLAPPFLPYKNVNYNKIVTPSTSCNTTSF